MALRQIGVSSRTRSLHANERGIGRVFCMQTGVDGDTASVCPDDRICDFQLT
jgi:hypothetical protein